MSKENTQARRRKAAMGISAIAVAITLLLGGTFAWQLIVGNEHKSSRAGDENEKIYDVTLVEDSINFTPNWRVGQAPLSKNVSVVNNGNVRLNGQPVYVRLSIKEYFEYAEDTTYIQTLHRYMVYDGVRALFPGEVTETSGTLGGKGRFVMFDNENDAQNAFPNNIVAQADIVTRDGGATQEASMKLQDIITGDNAATDYWFVRTQYGDDDGEYGKFMTVGTELGDVTTVGSAPKAADLDVNHNTPYTPHVPGTNDECAYDAVNMFDTAAASTNAAFREWVALNITGGNFQALSTWGGEPVEKWIYNDVDQRGGVLSDPYLYWGQALLPGETTLNALDTVQLVKQPGGTFFYTVHVDLEAVSIDALLNGAAWLDMPGAIVASYTENEPEATLCDCHVFDGNGQSFLCTIDNGGFFMVEYGGISEIRLAKFVCFSKNSEGYLIIHGTEMGTDKGDFLLNKNGERIYVGDFDDLFIDPNGVILSGSMILDQVGYVAVPNPAGLNQIGDLYQLTASSGEMQPHPIHP